MLNVDEESYGTFLVHLLSLEMLEILKTEVFAKNSWVTVSSENNGNKHNEKNA